MNVMPQYARINALLEKALVAPPCFRPPIPEDSPKFIEQLRRWQMIIMAVHGNRTIFAPESRLGSALLEREYQTLEGTIRFEASSRGIKLSKAETTALAESSIMRAGGTVQTFYSEQDLPASHCCEVSKTMDTAQAMFNFKQWHRYRPQPPEPKFSSWEEKFVRALSETHDPNAPLNFVLRNERYYRGLVVEQQLKQRGMRIVK